MGIVKKDGTLSTGITCLYQLFNGSFLYSEAAREEGEAYVFEAAKTCMVVMGPPRANGQTPYQVVRLDRITFLPQTVRVHKAAIILVQDTTDENLMKTARGVIAGLLLPGGAMPPVEKMN